MLQDFSVAARNFKEINMDTVSFIKVADASGVEIEHAIIDRGNNEFTSMLKSTYDAMQAEQSTPIASAE
jgi:hypothetical protein